MTLGAIARIPLPCVIPGVPCGHFFMQDAHVLACGVVHTGTCGPRATLALAHLQRSRGITQHDTPHHHDAWCQREAAPIARWTCYWNQMHEHLMHYTFNSNQDYILYNECPTHYIAVIGLIINILVGWNIYTYLLDEVVCHAKESDY